MAVCDYCSGEMLTVTGCQQRTYTIDGLEYPAVTADPHGPECHDCGALENEPHHPGCDMETCPHCGGQLISCGHGPEAFESIGVSRTGPGEMDTSEAMNRVEELMGRDSVVCSDCGQPVDLSEADTEMGVVETIASHHASHDSGASA